MLIIVEKNGNRHQSMYEYNMYSMSINNRRAMNTAIAGQFRVHLSHSTVNSTRSPCKRNHVALSDWNLW